MTILAVTPYTGSEKLVKMTEAMLDSFNRVVTMTRVLDPTTPPILLVAVNNAASRPIRAGLVQWHAHSEENEGFGNAINLAIKREIIEPPTLKRIDEEGKAQPMGLKMDITHVLVLNNDLQYPETNWLHELWKAREGDLVLSPCTDITATKEAVAEGPRDLDAIRCAQISAFCWLVPMAVIFKIRKKFGFNLFHPEFSNYGSDDVTGLVLRSLVSKKPFKVVPRSFVKHLKGQTANELGVRPGDPKVLQRIASFKRAHKLA